MDKNLNIVQGDKKMEEKIATVTIDGDKLVYLAIKLNKRRVTGAVSNG
jgi:hypothetical protein